MQGRNEITVLDKGYVRLVDYMGTDARICEAARVSYADYEKGKLVAKDRTEADDTKLINFLYQNKHTSPFEMCKITLDIKMPIFVARQYIRHRMQNVNEYSMRYKEAPDEFYVPTDEQWREQDKKNKQSSTAGQVITFRHSRRIVDRGGEDGGSTRSITPHVEEHGQYCFNLYKDMIAAGVAREMARMVLPLNLYTYFYATWDLKNLLHFITLREDAHAQAEIQEYGKAIKLILVQLFPRTMAAFERFKFVGIDWNDREKLQAQIARLTEQYNALTYAESASASQNIQNGPRVHDHGTMVLSDETPVPPPITGTANFTVGDLGTKK